MKRILIILCPLLAVSLPMLLAVASRSVPNVSPDPQADAAGAVAENGLPPRVAVDQPTYDFGTMDPLQTATHSFVIRNEGRGELKLATGSTTCKCTVSEITKPVIEPGGCGEVRITWNSGRLSPVYTHGATILTNDPRRRAFDLRVRGIVRVQLAASPAEIVLDGVEPDQPTSTSTWIYSQVWDAVTVERVTCSSEQIQCEAEPVDPSERPDLKAKSACRLNIHLPAGLPVGFFREVLTCELRGAGGDAVETLELNLSGKVLRRLSLYGPGLDASGTLDLGIVPSGQSLGRRLVLKVRDPMPELQVQRIQASPDFLDVRIAPYQTHSSATGLYHLNVRVPDTAPACSFRGAEAGRIKLEIDHPRIGDLELQVRLAVTDGG